MKQLSFAFKLNTAFFKCSLLFFVLSGISLLLVTKADSFILLNSIHSFWLNVFFVNYTFFGDGIFALSLAGFLFYRKQKKLALYILIAYLSSGLATQLLKNLIYAPRPRIFFEAGQYLYHLDNFGNSGGGSSSFPSGHTCSAFVLSTILALHSRKRLTGIALFFAATLVGYSRIYLAQHFPVDVLAGAAIGMAFGTLSFVFINSRIKIRFPAKMKRISQTWGTIQLTETASS